MIAKYIFVLILFISYITFDNSLGFSVYSEWWTHLTFAFQHVGWVHLIINSLVFINVFGLLEKRIKWYVLFPVIYLSSVASSLFFLSELPTVGCSGMIYSMFGMLVIIVIRNNAKIEQKIKFLSSLALMLIYSFFMKTSNFSVHFISLILGSVFWLIRTYYHRSFFS